MSIISKKACPECGSEDVMIVEPNSGLWMCKECQYTGHHFIDKEIIGRTQSNMEIGDMGDVRKTKVTKVRRRK